jgi:hypothetical protein
MPVVEFLVAPQGPIGKPPVEFAVQATVPRHSTSPATVAVFDDPSAAYEYCLLMRRLAVLADAATGPSLSPAKSRGSKSNA